MPLRDVIGTVPALIAIGVVPGFLVAVAVAPHLPRAWWMALAPGLSMGVVGILGLVTHRLSWGLMPLQVAVIITLAGAIAGWRLWASDRLRVVMRAPQSDHTAFALAALTGLATIIGLQATHLSTPLPTWDDAALHASIASQIVSHHDAVVTIPQPDGSFDTRPHDGFETIAALVSQVSGYSPARVLLPSLLPALAVLPLSLLLLWRELITNRWVLRVAILLTATLPFPVSSLMLGVQPLISDIALAPIGIAAVLRLRQQRDIGECCALLAAIAASMWVIHVLEVITVALFAGLLLLASPRQTLRAIRPLGMGLASGLAGIAIVVLLTPAATISLASSDVAVATAGTTPVGVSDVINFFLTAVLPGIVGTVLYFAGIAEVVLRRRLRWVAVGSIMLFGAAVDVIATGHLLPLWRRLFPWSVPDRTFGLQLFVAPLLMALGLVWLTQLLSRMRRPAIPRRMTSVVATTLVVFLVGLGVTRQVQAEQGALAAHGVVTDDDITVLNAVAQRYPHGGVLINDGLDDAGKWADSLTPMTLMLPKDWLATHPDDAHLVALQHACDDPAAAQRATHGAAVVFVGDRHDVNALHPWNIDCIRHLPNLTEIASSGGAAAFAVTPGS